ncbi:TonB-dependent receptor [Acinetobacter shaoyimingii]|uniref:TonB-dependent siderophore receptor n=1 Tax=Acinetobacter shaoyimingii TaxID=2715164 RepID=A0A6G8RSN8_9GAMM|nr:TonB-dependent siderophore receptor [Acinetobacter shaoyimingii]QIO04979.1 TonB-dependent siderophore receptor [Acinetobacter shaoyimingii]
MAFIKTRKKIVSSAIASSLSLVAGNAIAEDQVAQLETIQIQAQAEAKQSFKVDQSANSKFVAPLLDTAKSVSIISKQLLEDTQVTTLADALRTVPGVTLGAGEGGNPNGDRPFIRGYSSESSMYVDGVRNSTSQNREMFAVEQVEITKGSSSAMNGGGSIGGSVNMVSKVAKKGDSLEGSIAGGTNDYARITLDGNKDFGNGIAARVAVLGHMNDKAGQHDGAEYQRVGIAPSITFGLDTPTRATLSYYYLQSDDTPDSGVPYWNWTQKNADGTGKGTTTGKPLDAKQGVYYGWKDRDFQKQENQIGTLKLEHDLSDDITLSNTAVFNKSKNDYLWTQPDDSQGNIANGKVWRRSNSRITDTGTFTDQLSLAGKFNTGAIKHSFNVGAEYSRQETDRTSYNVNTLDADGNKYSTCTNLAVQTGNCTSSYHPNPNQPWTESASTRGQDKYNTLTETTSIYFLDSIAFTPKWILDLGLRWDKFDTEQVMTYGANNANTKPTTKDGIQVDPLRNVGDKDKVRSNTDFFSYQAGLTYKPRENGSIYFSYATSSNPVGIDQGDGDDGVNANYSNLDPERSQTFELGTKWDLFSDKLNVTAAIFQTEKHNARVQLDTTTYGNVGSTQVDGFELGINGKITDKWAISAGYTYLYTEATDNGKNCKGKGAKVNCTNEANPNNGNHLPNVPENSGTIWTTYQILPKLNIGVGAVAMDKVYGDLANTKYVPGYVRYDAMARYDVNKNLNVQLNYNNISDKRYFTKAYASHYATEAEGTNAVLAVNFKY